MLPMDLVAEQIWTGLATLAVLALVGALLRLLTRRGKYPRLPEPDPDDVDTAHDRRRYYLANALALLVGLVAGAAVWATPPLAETGVLWRSSLYDHPAARLLGPLFVVLAVGGLTVVPLAERLVAPGPLLHIMARSSQRQFAAGVDLRPALRWLSLVLGTLAVAVHAGVRNEHATFTADGVRWRNWPWQADVAFAWQDVSDIKLVRTFEAMTGKIVVRPHLSIDFRNGENLRLGTGDERPQRGWDGVAAIASACSGVVVRTVERE
jgi:hypothetical protein